MEPIIKQISWKRNLFILCLGELVALIGFSVVLPFLPYYVQYLGITGTSQVAFWSGLLLSSQAVTMSIVAPIWGSLADRYGRKIMVVRAMLGGSVIITAMGFVQNVQQLVILRAIQGTLTGTVSAAMTLVASTTPAKNRGYALGILQTTISLGVSVGPLLGGWIADSMGYRAPFWITGGLLFAAGVLVSMLVHENFTPPDKTQERAPLWEGLLLVLKTKALMIVLGIRVLMRVAFRVLSPVLPLFIQSIAPPGTKIASLTGTIAGFASATSAVATIILGRLSDKIGPKPVLLVCSAVAGVGYALQSGVQTPTQLLTLRILTGAAGGGIMTSVSALQAMLVPKDRFGAVYGIDTSMVAAANAIAPMAGAFLTATWGLTSAFIGAAAIYGVATLIVGMAVPGTTNKGKKAVAD